MLIKGMIAGFIATLVLSAIMVMKSMMGLMPELDVAAMLAGMLGGSIALGWLMHFVIGTVAWGGGFALIYKLIPSGNSIIKGIVFGLAVWLIMMVVMMPMAEKGLFGMDLGIMAPVMTMMLHIIFGGVLGAVYAKLTPDSVAST
ncbi:DUF6789 family protein [Robiginitomaculum antarcticum]|uniref:DUF6789 family protein n=1 Tax=Robiginitomaculum antarcticum TaxID=437507 RepID=UPI0003791CFF|nr:DUF6789 family protein [Robiginitomaculum antarcticum]